MPFRFIFFKRFRVLVQKVIVLKLRTIGSSNLRSDILHRFRQTVAICLVLPVKWLTDDCQMLARCPTRHLSTPTRHLSDKYHIYTRHIPYIWQISGGCLVNIWCTYGTVYVWWAYGICLVYMWYLSDKCLVGVDICRAGHLTSIWQLSGDHLTGSTRQIVTVWRKRWCSIWFCLFKSTPMTLILLVPK